MTRATLVSTAALRSLEGEAGHRTGGVAADPRQLPELAGSDGITPAWSRTTS